MTSSENTNVFEQIDSICRSFRRELKDGNAPSIDDYLDGFDAGARPNLFRNLLHLELDFRRRQGEHPSAREYGDRFPELAGVVRQAFFLSTMASMDYGDGGGATMSLDASAVSQLGEYQLVRELGRGGFGIVFEARHGTRGNRVALKVLPVGSEASQQTASAERLHKFRQEFRSLSDISHPNLVGMQSLEVDGDQWFLTMDLVQGIDFVSYVRPEGKLDEARLRSTLPQLVSGLMALHTQHVVHRDVKPSNVMVTPEGRVRVLDFGLVAEIQQSSIGSTTSVTRHFAGTPVYAAPEQITGTRTAASDWYAMGIMLYEALTGELPYQGAPFEVMTQKQTRPPPPLDEHEDVPQDLAELAMRLLARQPDERPGSLEIARLISANLPISHSSKSGEQILVGRETHLQSMQQAYDDFLSGRKAAPLFVEGRSGEGKTTLVEYFLHSLRRSSDVVVLSGRCYDRESVPLKALDCLIDPLCNWLRSQKDDAVAYLPDDIHMLAHLFPVMRRVDVVATAATKKVGRIDMKQVRQRALVALREMLGRISQQHPVILFVDDLQWGDADSAAAIFELLKPPDPPAVMLLGTYRSDEADQAPFVQTCERRGGLEGSDRVVGTGPLSLENCVELVVARLGEDTASIRDRAAAIFEATGGNPYFLDQLIESLDADTDTFHAVPLQEIVDRKLQNLPESASRLLELISLSGHAVALPEISQAAGEAESVVSTITHMRTERLVRLIDSSDQQLVDTYHDKIRELTIERLPCERKKELHRTLGEAIERIESEVADSLGSTVTDSPRVYDLAYHFDAVSDNQKALHYAMAAAEQARDQFALDVALEHYSIAERHHGHATAAERYRFTAGYGEALLLAGRYEDAEPVLITATDLTDDRVEKARVEALLAEIVYKTKTLNEAIEAYYTVLQRLGVRIPKSTVGKCVSTLWLGITWSSHQLRPDRWYARQPLPDEKTLLTVGVLMAVAYPTYFHSTIDNLWAMFKMSDFGRRHPRNSVPPYAISGACGWSVAFCLGFISVGERSRTIAMQVARALGDLHLLALEARGGGYANLAAGRFQESNGHLSEAASLLETRVSDAWQLTITKFWRTCVQFRLGNLANANQEARDTFELANRFSQHRLAQSALYIWTRASDGNVPFDQLRECIQIDPADHTAAVQFSVAEAIWYLQHGRTEEALTAAERAATTFRHEWILNQETVGCLPILARALRSHAQSVRAINPRLAKRLLRRALKVARWAMRFTNFLRLEYPFALREYGLALAANGRLRKAHKVAAKSCQIAEQQQARYELAQSRLVLAQLSKQLGQAEAERQIETAQAELAEFEQIIALSSGESETMENYTVSEIAEHFG